jgi:GT2 family glycosyltransferase
MTQDISFSVIIPSFNRRKYLMDTLRCLEVQTVLPAEVIVVDASAFEYRLNEDELNSLSLPLNYIEWDEIGNICKQRNHGIEIASSEHILFLDDDVQFESDLIANYIEAFRATGADGISGLVETRKRRAGDSPFRYKGLLLDLKEENLQPCAFIAPTRLICTASFAVTKSALKAAGCFDLNQRGTYDDVELGFRLAEAGFKVIHHPGPRVFHFQSPASGARDAAQGQTWNRENQVYFLAKHIYTTSRKFMIAQLLEILRPSRNWLMPFKIIREAQLNRDAYRRAKNLLNKSK